MTPPPSHMLHPPNQRLIKITHQFGAPGCWRSIWSWLVLSRLLQLWVNCHFTKVYNLDCLYFWQSYLRNAMPMLKYDVCTLYIHWKKEIKLSLYIKKFRGIESKKVLIYSENICAFPHILGIPSSYMTLHPSHLNFLKYEENFVLYFISVRCQDRKAI